MTNEQHNRWFGWLTRIWDWVDKRDIDKHFASWFILVGTFRITQWAMAYADSSTRPGLEVAAIIAAVVAPLGAVQAAALKFYFEVRSP